MKNDEFLAAIVRLQQEVGTRIPVVSDLVRRVRNEDMPVEDAVLELWRASAEDPSLAGAVEDSILRAFGLEPSSTSLAHLPDRDALLERWGFSEEDLVYQPDPERPLKMLHPILMGAIIELLQFDGDVPELRTGKMPEGGAPAVPVSTTARDPVIVGAMLVAAREDVAAELVVADREHRDRIKQMEEATSGVASELAPLLARESERAVGVQGYRPGTSAALRVVDAPSGLSLARMSSRERQGLSYLTLTSTQGRRSLVPVIAGIVLDALHERGYTALQLGHEGSEFAEAEWRIAIDGGKGETNPNFDFVDVASQALIAKLCRQLANHASRYTRLSLQVSVISNVAERSVGWRATVRQ